MLNEFIEKILVHERDRKGSIQTTQGVEIYFNFVGRFVPPAFGEVELTPEELEEIRKRCLLYTSNYIAVAIDSQQSSPSQAQAKRMRELDEKKLLNGDVIDGIMMEDKKEVDKVILTGAELSKYFGKETTPREMKMCIRDSSVTERY